MLASGASWKRSQTVRGLARPTFMPCVTAGHFFAFPVPFVLAFDLLCLTVDLNQ
jgi:hypothetical protein